VTITAAVVPFGFNAVMPFIVPEGSKRAFFTSK